MKFGKRNGYFTYTDRSGNERFTHRRVMEKKLGGRLADGIVVHHLNEDKSDNRPTNLVAMRADIHARHHRLSENGRRVCFRCGYEGHVAADCYAVRDWKGQWLK